MLKKIVAPSVLLFLLIFVGTAFAEGSGFKPRIGCVPFMATSLQAMAFTEDISSSLRNNIDRSKYFEIVERKKIEQVLELEGLRLDNLDNDTVQKISAKASLDYLVYGSVSVSDSGTILNINLLNVRTRKALMKESFSMSQTDFSRKLLEIAGLLVERVKAGANQLQAAPVDLSVKTPDSLEASGSANSIRLMWQSDMKQVAGFNIYRSVSIGGQYSQHATTTETSFTDENMKLNEEFYYRVAAVGNSGNASELTAPVRGATAIAPPSPIFMNIEPDIKGARLIWRSRSASAGDSRTEVQGYRIYRKMGEETAFTLVARLPFDAVSYADNGLSDGMQYIYTITSHNKDGTESEYSSKLAVMPLSVPNAIRVSAGKIRHAPLSWDRYSAEQAEGYVLYRSDKKDGSYTVVARLAGLSTTSYTDRELADNATYWYRVSVFKKGGLETAPSEPVSVITRSIPPAPFNLIATSGQPRMVTLKWQLAGIGEDEIKSVAIYRMMDEKGVTLEKLAEVSSSQNEFVDNKLALQDKTTYYYRLAVQNSGGAFSQQTQVVSATTKHSPAIPANFKGSSGGVKSTSLSWDKNREKDIKEYQIFRKQPGDIEYKQIKVILENRYQDVELQDGTEYSYKIKVADSDGLVSAYSDPVLVRTKLLPAKVVGFKAVDAVNRVIAWQLNREKDVSNYNIYKKGFLGVQQKVATVQGNSWQVDEAKGNVELYVTAVDESGLESEPSDAVVFKER